MWWMTLEQWWHRCYALDMGIDFFEILLSVVEFYCSRELTNKFSGVFTFL